MVVMAALVLLALFWFFFLRGGDEPSGDALPPPPDPAVTDTDVDGDGGNVKGDGKGGDGPGDGPVETTEVFAPRDPFKPLLTSGGGETSTDTTGDTTDVTGDTTDTTADPDGTIEDPTDPDSDDGTDGNGGGGENVEGHTVELVGINGDGKDATAQIQVDDTIYTVEEGETFAENFELLSTSSECATVLYGDDQFTVCEGEEILK